MAKIVILLGSPTPKSRLHGVLDRVSGQIAAAGHELSVVNVRELPAEDLLHARFDSEAIIAASRQVAEADAVIVASPVYKASFTGILKAFLDLLPQKGLENKIVLPIVVGGTIAHLLAIDYAMKPILSVMGARNILTGVFVLDTQVVWKDNGEADIAEEAAARLDASVQLLVQEAAWQSSKAGAVQ
ncbi:NADPH-dependent FMN reductase [Cohnella nanjingensis]|uniref:NADPH-dependent FMN reductase n=1 Tax=Cohnella nanjingensis TaxID=1387779 RepID=A0A7X0RPA3_9BACL|nr:NADPH-dependent FMN reductase [Cohnella nanjingensis]MBB6669739.1 NADPH-dependent FMN reductase [Cohnella nanjingensis]